VKSSKGLSLIEVVVAMVISTVVILIIYGVFLASDSVIRTESPLRMAQLKVQEVLDNIAKECEEAGKSFIWDPTVSVVSPGEPLPASSLKALVYLSARDGNQQFQLSSLQPDWQQAITIVPTVESDGTVALRRFVFPKPSASPSTCVPWLIDNGSTLTLQWRDKDDTSVVVDAGTSVSRTSGIVRLTDVISFSLTKNTQFTAASGDSIAIEVWQVGASRRAQGPKGTLTTGANTSIFGRNASTGGGS
jgi:prepilin-type N-terminal cleavage/methylation domain-containing protein